MTAIYSGNIVDDPSDQAFLKDALAALDPALLLNCLIQLTGRIELLDRYGAGTRQQPTPQRRLVPATEMPPAQAAAVVAAMATVMSAYTAKDAVSPAIPLPDHELFARMAALAVGQPVAPEFVPLLLEQAGFQLEQPVVPITRQPPDDFDVAIIGAGISGIHTAVVAASRGFRYHMYERAADIGGTWLRHTYDGVAVDTPSLYYSFSHDLNPDWTDLCPSGEEYQHYLHGVVDRYRLRENASFGTDVTALRWVHQRQRWELTLRHADGSVCHTTAAVVITAAGYLNRPSIPDIPGRNDFAGVQCHTADWDPTMPLDGRRVGVVGVAATGVQVVPAIIDRVAQLTLFQRQPAWVAPKFPGDGPISEQQRWAMRTVPYYAQWARLKEYWFLSDALYPAACADEQWMRSHPESISAANDNLRRQCLRYIDEMFADMPELAKKMTPDFPPLGKRLVTDPGNYYASLRRAHADVQTSPIARIVDEGILSEAGELVGLDVIIWATGYTLDFLSHIDVIGRDGRTLAEAWQEGEEPAAYLGGTVPGFPNLFITSSPCASPRHGGGHNFTTEVAVHYIAECLQLVVERGARAIEVTPEALAQFNAEVDAAMARTIWGNAPTAHNYFRSRSGRLVVPWPARMVDLWTRSRRPVEDHFVLH